jgi:excisionase family DNA binding protein
MAVLEMPPRLLSSKEVGRILGISQFYVWELVRDGKLRSLRLSPRGQHRFRVEDIERFMAGETPDD